MNNFKCYYTFILFFFISIHPLYSAPKTSAIYGGGPLYYNSDQTIPDLRQSGFTTVIVWTIHIEKNGDMNFNGRNEFSLVSDGTYIGDAKYPDFPKNMELLKTPPTSVTRVEFGLSAYGSSTFDNIRNLIGDGGPDNVLYKNFKALREAISAVDAINFDDENTYHTSSAVKFAVMLIDIGYKVTLCPYTKKTFWRDLAEQTNQQRPGGIDAVFLQCYDGGVNNHPRDWNLADLPLYCGLWDKDYSPQGVQSKLSSWKSYTSGGFMWLYDRIFINNKTKEYANAVNSVFNIATVPQKAEIVYPVSSSTGVEDSVVLQWKVSETAQSYDIYFGKSNPPDFINNTGKTDFFPGLLELNTKFYWRIDAKNFFGTKQGDLWSFTTRPQISINNSVINLHSNKVHAYPNPFSKGVSINFPDLNSNRYDILILNNKGQIIKNLSKSIRNSQQVFVWNGTNNNGKKVSPGVYFLRYSKLDDAGKVSNESKMLIFN